MIATVRYDLRAPAELGADQARQYAAALEQCTWADTCPAFGSVVLSEHHAVPDGYCPSPIVFGAAVAARTRRLLLVLSALVLPLHEPLRMAEDLAVLDLVSGGRLVVVFAAGYRAEEFAMFGRAMAGRGPDMEETVSTVRAAWRGEPVPGGAGPVYVTPRPASPGGPTVLLGGSSAGAARRAARVADGFMPGVADPAFAAAYHEERARLGRDPGYVTPTDQPMGVFIAEDPEAAWARIGPHALYEVNSYGAWEATRPGAARYTPAADPAELLARGQYRVLTPEQCVAYCRALPADGGVLFHPLIGGLDPAVGWETLELFASRVVPRLAEPAAGGPLDRWPVPHRRHDR